MDEEGLTLGGVLKEATFQSKDGKKSFIDITLQTNPSMISNYHSPQEGSLSDHIFIAFDISVGQTEAEDQEWWDLKHCRWEAFAAQVDRSFNERAPQLGAEELERAIIINMNHALNNTVPRVCRRSGKQLWSKKLAQEYKKYCSARQRRKRNQSCPHTRSAYYDARKRFQVMLREERKQRFLTFLSKPRQNTEIYRDVLRKLKRETAPTVHRQIKRADGSLGEINEAAGLLLDVAFPRDRVGDPSAYLQL
jgi:hypothetical protein